MLGEDGGVAGTVLVQSLALNHLSLLSFLDQFIVNGLELSVEKVCSEKLLVGKSHGRLDDRILAVGGSPPLIINLLHDLKLLPVIIALQQLVYLRACVRFGLALVAVPVDP